MTKKTLSHWGLSMYGGYYANYYTEEGMDGTRAKTLKELRAKLAELNVEGKLTNERRYDN